MLSNAGSTLVQIRLPHTKQDGGIKQKLLSNFFWHHHPESKATNTELIIAVNPMSFLLSLNASLEHEQITVLAFSIASFPCVQGWNSGLQAFWQALYPLEPPHQSSLLKNISQRQFVISSQDPGGPFQLQSCRHNITCV